MPKSVSNHHFGVFINQKSCSFCIPNSSRIVERNIYMLVQVRSICNPLLPIIRFTNFSTTSCEQFVPIYSYLQRGLREICNARVHYSLLLYRSEYTWSPYCDFPLNIMYFPLEKCSTSSQCCKSATAHRTSSLRESELCIKTCENVKLVSLNFSCCSVPTFTFLIDSLLYLAYQIYLKLINAGCFNSRLCHRQ